MQFTTNTLALLSLALSANACIVKCLDGSEHNVDPLSGTPCKGKQAYIRAAPGYADLVSFDGGKHYQCVDSGGFDLTHIRQNVISCSNGVRGSCCGYDRC